jgi:hypothetical protein
LVATFSTVTVTAGSTAPLESVTRPTMSAVPCAKERVAKRRTDVKAPPRDRRESIAASLNGDAQLVSESDREQPGLM